MTWPASSARRATSGPRASCSTGLAAGPIATRRPERLEVVLLGLAEGLARAGGKTIRDGLDTDSPVTTQDAGLGPAPGRGDGRRRRGRARPPRAGRRPDGPGRASPRPGGSWARCWRPGEPQRVQLAAVRTLAAVRRARRGVDPPRRWPSLSPAVRSEVLARLLSRPSWRTALLDAIGAGTVPAAADPAQPSRAAHGRPRRRDPRPRPLLARRVRAGPAAGRLRAVPPRPGSPRGRPPAASGSSSASA